MSNGIKFKDINPNKLEDVDSLRDRLARATETCIKLNNLLQSNKTRLKLIQTVEDYQRTSMFLCKSDAYKSGWKDMLHLAGEILNDTQ